MKPWIATCALIGALLVVFLSPAQAQTKDVSVHHIPNGAWNRDVSIATREAARTVFLEGNRLFRVPLFSRAAESYRTALATWKHPAFYFNLSLALLNLGAELEAHDALQLALRDGPAPIGADQYQEGKKQLADLERRLAKLRITCATPGAEVALDGIAVFIGPGDYEGWVAAKAHQITARKSSYLSATERVVVAAGGHKDVELALISVDQAADAGRRWAKWKPWTVVIAGAAIGAGGGALHAVAARDFRSFDHGFLALPCATSGGCGEDDIPAGLSSRLDRAHREQQFAVAAYITGGAVLAAGVVLLYLNRPRLLEQQPVAIVPAISPDQIGLAVSVRL